MNRSLLAEDDGSWLALPPASLRLGRVGWVLGKKGQGERCDRIKREKQAALHFGDDPLSRPSQ